jgi:hypothetical protein
MAVVDCDAVPDFGASNGDFVAIEGRDGGRAVASLSGRSAALSALRFGV